MKRHFTAHCENLKAELRELKTEDLPNLVRNEVSQAVEDRKTDIKDVIYVVLRSPQPMYKMASVILDDHDVLRTFAQYSTRRVEEAVDT